MRGSEQAQGSGCGLLELSHPLSSGIWTARYRSCNLGGRKPHLAAKGARESMAPAAWMWPNEKTQHSVLVTLCGSVVVSSPLTFLRLSYLILLHRDTNNSTSCHYLLPPKQSPRCDRIPQLCPPTPSKVPYISQ